ncbi:MAG TPA: DUF6377 domain-containing protein [Chitinophagaceae bacterium]|nr:DUF6377 domain-containing protein [Chitinophagaceae bacterium]
MKPYILYFFLLFVGFKGSCQSHFDDQLNKLNETIMMSPHYDNQKLSRINHLDELLAQKVQLGLTARFDIYLRLFREYKVFRYDSAYKYARKLEEIAYQLNDRSRIAYARMEIGFTLLSSGMFKETLDSLNRIDIYDVPDSLKAGYYALKGRFYYDLGDYDNDSYYMKLYNKQGDRYMDSALLLYPPHSFEYLYLSGLKDIRSGNKTTALTEFRDLLDKHRLSDHQLALTASTLSDIYIQNGETDTAISLLITATIADVRSSTKETTAIFNLAQLLYKRGDVKDAYDYIESAIGNAIFYGARQRMVQVSDILPLIEGEKMNLVEREKKTLIIYSIVSTFLLLLVIALAIIIFRQVSRLKIAKKKITIAHEKEQEVNHKLAEVNDKLSEANKIKEEYIGYVFSSNSDFFIKMERIKKSLEQKLETRKLDEIRFIVNNINLKGEKEDLLKNFDKIFLKLFPNFIAEFNVLFREEDRITLQDNELMNTDLRIFALIRMGIHDNEKIAEILEYSVHTINTYKTKIKNKSLIPNEEFERRILAIKTL